MADELDQTSKSEDSSEAKIELLQKALINELSFDNKFLAIVDEANKRLENCYERIDSLNDQLTCTKKENDDLKSVNTLLTKRLQEREKDLADLGGRADISFYEQLAEIKEAKLQHEELKSEIKNMELQAEKLKSEIKNLELENEKLKSELENAKLQNEASPSEVDKLMVLYRCSEKEKCIASMKLLDAEENIRKLRNKLHNLQNETKRHKNDNNEEKVQTSFHLGSEVNENEKPETYAIQSIKKKDKELLEKETMILTNKFCEEFEAKFEEKRSSLITKLTSCDDQTQVLKKLSVKLKEEKLELLDIMEEMDGDMSNFRNRVDELAKRCRRGCYAEKATRARLSEKPETSATQSRRDCNGGNG